MLGAHDFHRCKGARPPEAGIIKFSTSRSPIFFLLF
jgi:hypothetical protein